MFQVHEQKGSMRLGLNNQEQFSFLLCIQQEEWLVQSQFPFQQAPYVRLTYLIKKSLINNHSSLSSYSGTVKHPYPIVDMIDQVVLAVKYCKQRDLMIQLSMSNIAPSKIAPFFSIFRHWNPQGQGACILKDNFFGTENVINILNGDLFTFQCQKATS